MNRLFLLISFVTIAHGVGAQRLSVNLADQYNINPLYKKDILIRTLDSFFTNGRTAEKAVQYWSKADLEQFGYPWEIAYLGYTDTGKDNFPPVYLGAIDIVPQRQYLVKLAFLPAIDSLKRNMGRVLNLIANYDRTTGQFTFEQYTNYFIKDWYQQQVGTIRFYKERRESFNFREAAACSRYNDSIAAVFKVPPKKIIYYSCKDPVQMFNLMGYDFRYEMFLSRTGGMRIGNRLYSARNAESYPHEIAHFYIPELEGSNTACTIASEGIATYFGGSDPKTFKETAGSLYRYLLKYPNVPVDELLFKDMRTDDDVSRLYATGGVLAKLIYARQGLEGWRKFLALSCSNMKEALPILIGKGNDLKQIILEAAKKISEA